MLYSLYAQLLLALYDRIAAEVPEIRYMDQDFGQLEILDELGRPPVSWPCLLFDFTGTNYDQLLQQVQTGNLQLQVRLGFAPYSASNSLAPTDVKKKALQYYELENKVYVALQGWDAGGLCQPFTRTADGTERREDTYRVRVLTFSSQFEDTSATPAMQKVPRPPLEFNFCMEV